jgi:Na+-driven multidrug efflux pump
MQQYNNIVSEYSEYFFENFKGGRGGGKRKKKGVANDDKDRVKENITTIIFFAIFAFIYFIYILYPKQTNAVLKRYDAYNYMNDYIYLAIAFIVFVLLYVIVAYVYNHLDTSVVNNK